VDFSVSGHIHRYIHTFCLRVLPKRYQVTQLQHSVYTLDAAIVEGYRHGTVHSKCINDHTLRSDIFLPKCPTNLRVNTLKSDYLVGHRGLGRTWEWIFKDLFLHFSRWICQTFCDRCVFVSVLSFRYVECAGSKYPSVFLPCTIFAPGKVDKTMCEVLWWNISISM
jgi:hypothetical protein